MSFIQVLPLVILMVPSVPSFRRVLHSLHQVLQLQPCNTLNLLSLQTTSEWRRKELVGDNKFMVITFLFLLFSVLVIPFGRCLLSVPPSLHTSLHSLSFLPWGERSEPSGVSHRRETDTGRNRGRKLRREFMTASFRYDMRWDGKDSRPIPPPPVSPKGIEPSGEDEWWM